MINLPANNNSGNPEEIQINLGGSNGSAGQVTIDINQPQNGAPEQVAINISQQNNEYKVVIDLLNAVSNSPAQTCALSLHA